MPAVVYTQSWTGTTGADWPSGWTFMTGDTSGTTSRSINANRGAQTVTGVGAFRNDMLTGLGNVANFEVVVTIDPGDTTGNGTNPAFFFRASSSNPTLTGCYLDMVFLAPNFGRLRMMLAPAYSGLQDHLFTHTPGKQYYLKVRGNGTSVQARIWATDAAEPGTWGIDYTENTHTTGRFGFTHYGANAAARTVYWDDMQVTDLDAAGAQTVTPTGISTAQAFGTPTVSPGPVSVAPTGIASDNAFGPAVITGGIVVAPTGIASSENIGNPTVSGGTVVAVVPWPTYGNAYGGFVTPLGIPSTILFGTLVISVQELFTPWPSYGNAYQGGVGPSAAPTGIPSGEALGTPVVQLGTVNQTVSLSGLGIVSLEQVRNPVVTVNPPPPAPPPPPPPPAPPAPPVPLPVAYLPLPPAREVLVEVRAPDLTRVGMIDLRDIVDFRATLRYQNLGSWSIRLQPNHPMSSWLSTPKAGLIASLDGEVLFSGPVDGGNNYRSREVVNGRMVFTGVDDSYMLGDALAYPQPSNSNPSTQTSAYDTRTGVAETVMHAYVNANIGPGSPVARRVSDLTMASDLGRGPSVTHKARFEVLGEVLEALGKLGGLGFRVRQVGLARQFEVYQPRDLTASIRFDIFNDTLVSHEYGWGVHKASRAIVAGGGEGTARVIVERTTTDSLAAETLWGRRIERFVDQRQTEELAELQQAGDELLVEDGKTRTGLEIEPVDTYQVQFARDYYLGDRVTVTVDQIEIQDTITEVEITLDRNGLNAKPTLGQLDTISRHSQLRMLSAQHEQARRLSGLERKV